MAKTKKERVRALILARRGQNVKARTIEDDYVIAYDDDVSRSTVASVFQELCQAGLAWWGWGGGRNACWLVCSCDLFTRSEDE